METNLLSKINALGTAKAQRELDEWCEAVTRNDELKSKVSALAPRAKELINLANACITNNIEIGLGVRHDAIWHHSMDKYFLTDGVNHRVGFDYDWQTRSIQRIGMDGTGCCCWNFMNLYASGVVECDAHTHTFRRTQTQAMKNENEVLQDFLLGFDKFETRFKNYLESL